MAMSMDSSMIPFQAAPGNWDGAAVTVIGVDGVVHSAELLELPYYDADKHIARGLDTEIP